MANSSATLAKRCELARDILCEVAHANVAVVADGDLMSVMLSLLDASKFADAAKASYLAEMDARRVTSKTDSMRTADWLAQAARMPVKEAVQQTRVATALRNDFAEAGAAVKNGVMSMGQAAALVGLAKPSNKEQLKAKQGALVALAKDTEGFEPYKNGLNYLVSSIDRASGYDPAEDPNAQVLYMKPRIDGGLDLDATGYGVRMVGLQQSLDGRANTKFYEYKDRGEVIPSRARLLMESLYDMNDEANEYANGNGRGAPGKGGKRKRKWRARSEVLVVVEAKDEIGEIHDPNSARITKAQAEELMCDPWIRALIVNKQGEPLWLGQKQALASPHQRRALEARDGGCGHPGCDTPADWCEAHHVIFRRNNGPTDVDNMMLVCKTHHGIAHSENHQLRARTIPYSQGDDTGPFEWVEPDGTITPSQTRRSRQRIARENAKRLTNDSAERARGPD